MVRLIDPGGSGPPPSAIPQATSGRSPSSPIDKGDAVANLVYSALTSIDGFVADENGNFDWAAPDAEVHAFVNDLERPADTYLLGRRMYEVLAVWDSDDIVVGEPPVIADYAAIWRAADKIVYSSSLESAST